VRRLQHHASVALWAGNNENEVALVGNWFSTDANFSVYRNDYLELYVSTVMNVVKAEDRPRPFIVRFSVCQARDRYHYFFNLAVLTQNIDVFFKKIIMTLAFKKMRQCFKGNWQKSQKIEVITSAPGSNTRELQRQR
jgi:hypothetical protein